MDTDSVICEAGREIEDLGKCRSSKREAGSSCSDLLELHCCLRECMFLLISGAPHLTDAHHSPLAATKPLALTLRVLLVQIRVFGMASS
jgi:hypothetical protein